MRWFQDGNHAFAGNMHMHINSLWDKSSISRATSHVNGDSLVITSDIQSMISCVSISLDSMYDSMGLCLVQILRFWYKTSDIFSVYMAL